MVTENATMTSSQERERSAPISDSGRWGGSLMPMPDPYAAGRRKREAASESQAVASKRGRSTDR